MKARSRRPRAFIVSNNKTPVKHDARVLEVTPKTIHTSLVIRGYCFRALISHVSMYFKTKQKMGILLLFVVSHVVVKMAESFAANNESLFRSPNWGRRIKVAAREHS